MVPKFQQTIQERMATMTDLNHDGSLNDRERMYNKVTSELLNEPSGVGLLNGSTYSIDDMPLDSGLIQIAIMLGFVGAAFYAAGIVVCLAGMVQLGGVAPAAAPWTSLSELPASFSSSCSLSSWAAMSS